MSTLERERNAVEALMQSPQLGDYADSLKSHYEEEQARRLKFQDEVSPDEKAEFINGEIIMHSPVRLWHNRASSRLNTLINMYTSLNDIGGEVGIEKLMISLTRNDYEPDICYFSAESAAQFTDEQTLFPAPDFIAEVLSPSTEKRDRGIKFEDYARHNIREYWIIDPFGRIIEQYELVGEEYTLRQKVRQGEIDSVVITGFVLPVQALFDATAFKQAKRDLIAKLT